MRDRPYVTLSCAMSIDGHIDDLSEKRLLLSNDQDFDRVDAVRAEHDAILVGATTLRRDDPRLLVRSERRRAERTARGATEHPVKVTLTRSGDIDPDRRFFTTGQSPKLVYAASTAVAELGKRLEGAAEVIDAGDPPHLPRLLADLSARGIKRLMVEGGGQVHTRFLTEGLVDELHLVIAPFLIGQDQAPRFVHAATFPQHPDNPLHLTEARQIGEVVLLRYHTTPPQPTQ